MELLKTVAIDKNRTDFELPNVLLDDEFIGVDTDKLIMIYYLKSDMISYPNRNGKVIFIGDVNTESNKGLGTFTHIIENVNESNDDTSLNYALSSYYNRGKKIELCIYKVPRIYDANHVQELLIKYHMNIFGCHPIAQGHLGTQNTSNYINHIISEGKNSDIGKILSIMD